MDSITDTDDGDVRMIGGMSVRVHHSAATLKNHPDRDIGRSRGGLTSKIHVLTDGNGLSVCLSLTPGQTHDAKATYDLIHDMVEDQMLLADRAYDAHWIRNLLSNVVHGQTFRQSVTASERPVFSLHLYRDRNKIERFFNKLKYFRRIATRYDKCGATYLGLIKRAATRIQLRFYEVVV